MQNWDLVTERHTLNEGNKRGDWMKHWLMLQGHRALLSMFRKIPGKQTTYRSPKGGEKQIDYILTKRRYLKYNKDAEANDMVHLGSDHRCVMATFVSLHQKRVVIARQKKGKLNTTKHEGRIKPRKTLELRSLSSKKRYQEIIEKVKEKMLTHKKKAAQAKSENVEAEVHRNKGDDGVETSGEAGEGHLEFHTVNEEAGHIVLRVEHVEHAMDDDMGGENDD